MKNKMEATAQDLGLDRNGRYHLGFRVGST